MLSHCQQVWHEPAELVLHAKEPLYVVHVYQLLYLRDGSHLGWICPLQSVYTT